jgi:hypothetical protein
LRLARELHDRSPFLLCITSGIHHQLDQVPSDSMVPSVWAASHNSSLLSQALASLIDSLRNIHAYTPTKEERQLALPMHLYLVTQATTFFFVPSQLLFPLTE